MSSLSLHRIPIHDLFSKSTEIWENISLSSIAIEDIQSRIEAGRLSNIEDELSNIIKVFNENVRYMDEKIPNHPSFEPRTLEQHCQVTGYNPNTNVHNLLLQHYQNAERVRELNVLEKIDELDQFQQLCYLHNQFSLKILHAIKRLNLFEENHNIKKTVFPQLEEIQYPLTEKDAPELKIIWLCTTRYSKSTQITKDFLLSSIEIKRVQSKIKEGNPLNVQEDLLRIIQVFNKNIDFMNTKIPECPYFQPKSFERFCKPTMILHPSYNVMSDPFNYPLFKNLYQNYESIRQTDLLKKINRFELLKQLCYLHKPLSTEITLTIKNLNDFEESKNSQKTEFPKLQEIRYQVSEKDAPKLRHQLPIHELPTIRLFSENPTAYERAIETEPVYLPEESSGPSVNVTVKVYETKNNGPHRDIILGVCCDPHWENAPIPCAMNESNHWIVQVPLHKDWKFVLMQDNKVIKWESRNGNRKSGGSVASFTLDKVTFPEIETPKLTTFFDAAQMFKDDQLLKNEQLINNSATAAQAQVKVETAGKPGTDCSIPEESSQPAAVKSVLPAPVEIFAPAPIETEYSLPIVKVTVKSCEIKNGFIPGNSTLAVCCEPHWEKAPIPFTKDESGNWAGQPPLQKDWKFVLMQGDKIVKWENRHGNRKCDGSVGSFTLNKVTF